MIWKMIIDADICIKLGGSAKYPFLYELLPKISREIYMHTHAHNEVLLPPSAVEQLERLTEEGIVVVVDEKGLNDTERAIYDLTYEKLSRVMLDTRRPNKNRGELCSLAYAKAKSIPVFATDEANLQPIIDSQLNTGNDDIYCLRIIDIVKQARNGDINISRKYAKALWVVAGKSKSEFDEKIWPI